MKARFLLILFLALVAGPADAGSLVINEFFALGKGKWPDWIELYNRGKTTVQLKGYSLTDDLDEPFKWTCRDPVALRPGEYALFVADKKNIANHTNFRLNSKGEELALFNDQGDLVDHIEFGPQIEVMSVGRYPDGAQACHLFGNPTPKARNMSPARLFAGTHIDENNPLSPPKPSVPTGIYPDPFSVSFSPEGQGIIVYTLDGSMPDSESLPYTRPIRIKSNRVLRARTIKDGFSSSVVTRTYLIGESKNLPIVSIALDPVSLWDEEFGIYVKGSKWKGNNWDEQFYNYKQNWKRDVHVTMLGPSGEVLAEYPARVKIYGGASRGHPQKSLALEAEGNPGPADVFQKGAGLHYKTLLLRNSGDDWGRTMFRDVLMHTIIMEHTDIDHQSARPVILLLNGRYWGIHNLREKIDKHYLERNHNIPADQVDLIERGREVKAGSIKHYGQLLEFLRNRDFTRNSVFQELENRVDIEEFTDYQIAEIYFLNRDWPGNNIRAWRPQKDGGKWRWILYDTDNGFSCKGTKPESNALKRALQPEFGNSNLLIRKCLENPSFREYFIQRFASHLQVTFSPERVLGIISSLESRIEPEMKDHIQRWGEPDSFQEWKKEIAVLRSFAKKRPDHVFKHLRSVFSLNPPFTLSIDQTDASAGVIRVAGVQVPDKFSGQYFPKIPLVVEAEPKPGYVFVRWEGDIQGGTPIRTLSLQADTRIKAVWKRTVP